VGLFPLLEIPALKIRRSSTRGHLAATLQVPKPVSLIVPARGKKREIARQMCHTLAMMEWEFRKTNRSNYLHRHFAFLVSDGEFDEILQRIRDRQLPYWADPFRREPNNINTYDDGRGLYFDDPNGHLLEIITRPYGSGGRGARNPNPLLLK